MNPTNTLKQRRKQILEMVTKYGAHNVRVFGSIARGEADENSDVDLLVTIGPNFTLMDHVRLEEALQQLLGCKVDVISDGGLKRKRFRERILHEAVAL